MRAVAARVPAFVTRDVLPLQLIIDSEIWDLRTNKLIQSVPSLHRSQVSFSSGGNVAFGLVRSLEDMLSKPRVASFQTYLGTDFSPIADVPVGDDRALCDLSLDVSGNYVAVADAPQADAVGSRGDASIRVFEVGRTRGAALGRSLDQGDDVDSQQDEDEDDEPRRLLGDGFDDESLNDEILDWAPPRPWGSPEDDSEDDSGARSDVYNYSESGSEGWDGESSDSFSSRNFYSEISSEEDLDRWW